MYPTYPSKINPASPYFYGEQTEFSKKQDDLTDIYIHRHCDIGMHSHDFYEINIVFNGKGCHYIGDMAVPVEGGEFFVIPPNVPHGYYNGKDLDVCHILLHHIFLEKYGKDLASIPGYSTLFEIEPYLRQVHDSSFFLKLNLQQQQQIKENLIEIMNIKGTEFAAYRNILVLHFLSNICYFAKTQNNTEAVVSRANADILRVLEYIQMHFSEALTIEELTHISNMSRPTLHRHFKDIVKMTPFEYIIKCRVNAARQLLDQGQLSRTDIAQRCGFFDTSHMNKYIHK